MTTGTAHPTLAAVVLNYQYAAYVGDAVDSLLAQESPFSEVVVVDDGSKDNSLEVLQRYADQVRVVAKDNGGQLSACLAGLAASTSEYVYFLDADDLAEPGLVAAVRPLLADRPVKLQFQLRGVDGDLRPLDSVFPTFPDGYDAASMARDNATVGFYVCPPTSGNVFQREALERLDLASVDPREFIDGPPAMVAPHVGEVVSLNVPLAAYRVHGQNHSLSGGDLAAALRAEAERFSLRWEDGCRLLGTTDPPFAGRLPGYLLERQLMLAALGEHPGLVPLAVRYLARCPRMPAPPVHRLFFALWAVLLLLPVPPVRRRLVAATRSAAGRPAAVRAVVRLVRRLTARRA